MALAPGSRVGPYHILSLLGAGGMGEVYRARDTRLGRDVAIKVLPEIFTRDRDRLERFEREARLLAALNHPHIAAIYGMEEAGDVRGLVLELVEGPTLAERIQMAARRQPDGSTGGGLPVNDAVDIARQLIDALDVAHERGIVHRDLKPSNIKLTNDGRVKVLDFGLAKALDAGNNAPAADDLSESPTITAGGTREGIILGTAAYMSPEQARGLPLDKRTDIWSFGCVLYEMLTGKVAFGSASVSDSIAAILTSEPDWSALPAATPPHIRRLLGRCLHKDVKKRLRDIGDARTDLDEMPSSAATTVASAGSPSWRPMLWSLAGLAAGVAVGIGAMSLRRQPPPSDPMASGTIERVTRDTGFTSMPAQSPDGTLVSYASDRSGRGDLDIWVQQMAGGTPLRITDDPGDDWMPAFSPDGRQIAYRSDRANALMIVSALGGVPRVVAPDARDPKFSPDGTKLAYWGGPWRGFASTTASTSFVMPLSGAPSRVLPEFSAARTPIWAPDGLSLLVLARRDRSTPASESMDWWWVPLDGRPPVQSGLLDILGLRAATETEVSSIGAWTESGVVITSGDSVWQVPLSTATGRVDGTPRRMILSAGLVTHPTVSRSGELAFAVVEANRVIERVSINDESARPEQLYSDIRNQAGRPGVTADGRTIIYEQTFGQSHEIWIKNIVSGDARVVGRVDARTGLDSVISPDGRRVGYTARDASPAFGTGYVMEASGGVPIKLCEACSVHGFLSDSRRVLLVRGNRAIQVMDVVTRVAEDVVEHPRGTLSRPHASPDDRWLAFREADGKSFVTRLTPGQLSTPDSWRKVEEPTTTGRPAGWSPDSRTIYLLLDTDGFRCLWGQRIDPVSGALVGGVFAARHLHHVLDASTSFGNPITREGFVYGTNRSTANIWRLVPGKPES